MMVVSEYFSGSISPEIVVTTSTHPEIVVTMHTGVMIKQFLQLRM